MQWESESEIWGGPQRRFAEDWLPGRADVYLQARYRVGAAERLQKLSAVLAETSGNRAAALAGVKERLAAWRDAQQKSLTADLTAAQYREKFYQLATVQEAVALAGRPRSMRLAVEDHRQMFKDRYPQADAYLARIAGLEAKAADLWNHVLTETPAARAALLAVKQELDAAQGQMLLDTPLLACGKLLIVKGHASFASNWSGPNRLGDELVVLSPIRPDGRQTTIYKGPISDLDLHFGGQPCCFPTVGRCGR